MFEKEFKNLKITKPIIHNITNYVTVNDCANILIAAGASPIMSDDIDEVDDIVDISSGLCINIGTLNKRTIETMIKAGKRANRNQLPVLLDPVGSGASLLRSSTANRLIENINFSVIRGNASEIKALAGLSSNTKGVDASKEDIADINLAKQLSRKLDSVIVITGDEDIIAYDEKTAIVKNGNSMMADITGSGCMLSSIITAFISSNKKEVYNAAITAVISMGICGEIAFKRLKKEDGNSSFRNYLIDAFYNLDFDKFKEMARYEMA